MKKRPISKHIAILTTIFLMIIALMPSCTRKDAGKHEDTTVIVFEHGKIAGDPEPLNRLLAQFESENQGVRVKDETLPASSDEQHQFFVINLEAKSADFDVLSMDVVWVPEFAKAGWLQDLSRILPIDERKEFFPGPMAAVTWEGKPYAVPWFIDAGLLYYRKDLLDKYGFVPPRTWQELVDQSQFITAREKDLYGFVWQGKQYEGLVCNVLEYFWSNGGNVLRNGDVAIDSPANVAALGFMRDLIVKYKVSPPLVTTAIEEPTRHTFGNGRALFMRNWPYAWNIFEQENSRVKGKVGVAPLPSFPGGQSSPTLGGWQLGVNRYSRHTEAAQRLVRFLTSPKAQKELALTIGYKPTRLSLYRDTELRARQPFIAGLYDIFMKARPRPVTPYYPMITQVMQPEFSAALVGVKSPEEALRSASDQIGHILGRKR